MKPTLCSLSLYLLCLQPLLLLIVSLSCIPPQFLLQFTHFHHIFRFAYCSPSFGAEKEVDVDGDQDGTDNESNSNVNRYHVPGNSNEFFDVKILNIRLRSELNGVVSVVEGDEVAVQE